MLPHPVSYVNGVHIPGAVAAVSRILTVINNYTYISFVNEVTISTNPAVGC